MNESKKVDLINPDTNLYDSGIINLVKNLLESDVETFLIKTRISQKSCLALLTLVAASSESPVDKPTIELLTKIVQIISKLSANFITPNTPVKEIKKDYPSTSGQSQMEGNNICAGKRSEELNTMLNQEYNDNIKVVVAHRKGYVWKPDSEIKQMIQFIKEHKRVYHHMRENITNDNILKIIQITDDNLEIILVDFKIITLQKSVEESKIAKVINYFFEKYLEHINETLFFRKIKINEKNYIVTIYIKKEDIYNDILKSKWTIEIDNDQYKFYQKTKYKVCIKCKTAFSGGHIRCSTQ